VLRHFKWMRDYGIDGAFVQRFANGLKNEWKRNHKDVVLSSCREGANRGGRTYYPKEENEPQINADGH